MVQLNDASSKEWGRKNFYPPSDHWRHQGIFDDQGDLSFSIYIDVGAYENNHEMLERAISSLLGQPFQRWNLCLFSSAPTSSSPMQDTMAKILALDERISHLSQPSSHDLWSLYLAEDIQKKGAELIIFIADCIIPSEGVLHAILFEYIYARAALCYYMDGVMLDHESCVVGVEFRPHWDKTYLKHAEITGGLICIHKNIVARIQPDHRQETSWYHDMLRQISRILPEQDVYRIPYPLIGHTQNQTKLQISTNEEKTHQAPNKLVSIIIPTRNRCDLLREVMNGLKLKTHYQPIEIIVVNNGSDEPESLAYFLSLEEMDDVRIIHDNSAFNFSKLNNMAVEHAAGSFLLFLNNDIEMLDDHWLDHMVHTLEQEQAGAVGALLLYPDQTIQHAGVLFGSEAGAGNHLGAHQSLDWLKSMKLTNARFEVAAVTAACLLTKKEVFSQLGGFDPKLAVAFNDVDLCLRLRELGCKVIMDTRAVLIHHESKTRGSDHELANIDRAFREVLFMLNRWAPEKNTHPRLSNAQPGFTIKDTINDDLMWHERSFETPTCTKN